MDKAVKEFRRCRVRRACAFVVMLLSWAAMLALITAGALLFIDRLTAFMIAALAVGGVGTVAYFVTNLKFFGKERLLCAELVRSGAATEEILEKARELKIDLRILRIYIN